jgi:hypothetical protein
MILLEYPPASSDFGSGFEQAGYSAEKQQTRRTRAHFPMPNIVLTNCLECKETKGNIRAPGIRLSTWFLAGSLTPDQGDYRHEKTYIGIRVHPPPVICNTDSGYGKRGPRDVLGR